MSSDVNLPKVNKHVKCKWFSKSASKLSNLLYLPDDKQVFTNFDDKFFNPSLNCSYSNNVQNNINDKIIIKNNKVITNKEKLDKFKIQFQNTLERINNKYANNVIKRNISIKCATTKYNKKVNNINNITKSFSYKLELSKKQQNIINCWMNECKRVYDYCVKLFNEDYKSFNLDYTKQKLIIFDELYGNKKKPVPYDVITDEVRIFCSNVKSCLTNLQNKNITKFKLKYKKVKDYQSILIPKSSISKNGFYISLLGKLDFFKNIIDDTFIPLDSRLYYDKVRKSYYICIPRYCNKHSEKYIKSEVCSLDPGESIFMVSYGFDKCIKFGEKIRVPILNQQKNIRKLQSVLNKNKNKKGDKLNHKSKFKKKVRGCYRKIRNIVKELHNKTALYLCKNYNKILIPKFETQNMIRKYKIDKNKISGTRDEIKKYTKRRKMNKKVAFVLGMLSHYKFREHLKNKSIEYGSELHVVTEEYTSKCCGKCGTLSDNYKNRMKECSNCSYKINRDINGSRNILILNRLKVLKLRP